MTKSDLSRNLEAWRQVAAIAAAFTLPLTTSGQAIAVSIFAVLALLTVDYARLAAVFRTAAGLIPLLLFLLLLAGVLWSNQPFGLAIKWVGPYAKLLLIPLALATALTPRQALHIGYGFLAACVILLALSWASFLWPTGPWGWFKSPGVPVKDNAVQNGCFVLCAFGLATGAVRIWSEGEWRRATAMILLALLFFADVFLIYFSKTGALMAAALLALFIVQIGGWRRAMLISVPAVIVIAVALWASTPARQRVGEIFSDMRATSTSQESVSTAARLDFWNKALGFIQHAPVLGHGTGSIKPLYQSAEATSPSPYGEATPDPHNQFLAIVLQVGLLGGILLLGMWAAHFVMFLSRDFASVMGQAIVLQNFLGSLFNSHLSTVTQGMLYCLAVGLLGAVVKHAWPVTALQNSALKPERKSMSKPMLS